MANVVVVEDDETVSRSLVSSTPAVAWALASIANVLLMILVPVLRVAVGCGEGGKRSGGGKRPDAGERPDEAALPGQRAGR